MKLHGILLTTHAVINAAFYPFVHSISLVFTVDIAATCVIFKYHSIIKNTLSPTPKDKCVE
jgi:hypothetical protein